MGFIEKFLCSFKSIQKNIFVYEDITSTTPVIETLTLKAAEKEAELMNLKHPIFGTKLSAGAFHVSH